MQRREFLAAGAAVIADWRLRIADSPPPNPQSTIRNPQLAQEPTLAPEVFARRIERAQTELNSRKLDCLIATPGTNYRSEERRVGKECRSRSTPEPANTTASTPRPAPPTNRKRGA